MYQPTSAISHLLLCTAEPELPLSEQRYSGPPLSEAEAKALKKTLTQLLRHNPVVKLRGIRLVIDIVLSVGMPLVNNKLFSIALIFTLLNITHYISLLAKVRNIP